MRSLAAIAFSFSTAILLLGLLPAGSWIFWAAGLLAAVGGCVLHDQHGRHHDQQPQGAVVAQLLP